MKQLCYIFVVCYFILHLCLQNSQAEIKVGFYWANMSGNINRADMDGNNITTLYTDPPGGIDLIDIAVDKASESIFFTGFGYNVPSKIQQFNINTGTITLLYITSDVAIRSIAINQNEGKIYWTEEFHLINQGRIAKANLDGSNVEYILTTSSSNRMMPYGIDIDTDSNEIFWTDNRYGKIYKCNPDGSSLETLVNSNMSLTGISLDVAEGKMYWAERFGNLMRSNLDGSNVEIILDHQTDVIDLGLDIFANKLYWADLYNGFIYKSNLDGSGIEEIIRDQVLPIGIDVVTKNKSPIAVSGPNQVVYICDENDLAYVTLDGSAFFDDDNDILDYYWSWIIDSNLYEANGVSPTIQLPAGEHEIELIVDDGLDLSEPNSCIITIIEPLQAELACKPSLLNTQSERGTITAMLRMPEEITTEDIDVNEPLIFIPGYAEPTSYSVFERTERGELRTWIKASFNVDDCIGHLSQGVNSITVVGKLNSGRCYRGRITINVFTPKPFIR